MEKINLLELDIDVDSAVKNTKKLKEDVIELRKKTNDLKVANGETSESYINSAAQLKVLSAELKASETYTANLIKANKSSAGSIEQMSAELSVLNVKWKQLSEAERENTDDGKALSKSKLELADAINKAKLETGDATSNIGHYLEAGKSLRAELKELTAAMGRMELAGQQDSDVFIEMNKRAGEIKDNMDAARGRIKLFASDTKELDMAIAQFQAMAAGVQVAEGTMQLLGIENEEVERGIQKLVAIQSIMNGVQEVQTALQKESAFMIGIKTAAVKIATFAQWLWNGAMAAAAGPISIIISASVALAAAFYFLTRKTEENVSRTDVLTKSMRSLNNELEYITKKAEQDIKIMTEKGAKDTDITNAQIKNATKRIELLDQEADAAAEILELNIGKTNDMKNLENLSKIQEKRQQTANDLDILQIKLSNQKNAAAEKAIEEQELAEKEYAEKNIRNATLVYEYNKELQNRKIKELNISNNEKLLLDNEYFKKQIISEDWLYQQAVLIQKQQLKSEIINEQEYKNNVLSLKTEKEDRIEELSTKRIEIARKNLDIELEVWKLNNKSKLEDYTVFNEQIIVDEKNRLNTQRENELSNLEFDLSNKLIAQEEFKLKELEIKQLYNDKYVEIDAGESARKNAVLNTDLENELALNENNLFAKLDLQKKQNALKRDAEIKASEAIGASTVAIKKKYDNADLALEKAKTKAKIALAGEFAGNLATIFGEQTALGKAAAVAQTTISTYQSATQAYSALAGITFVGPILGAVAAAAAVTSGLANVKKILAVKSGLPGEGSGGGGASIPSPDSGSGASSTAALVRSSVNPEIGAGIVARAADVNTSEQVSVGFSKALKENPQRPVLVQDDVTASQNITNTQNRSAVI